MSSLYGGFPIEQLLQAHTWAGLAPELHVCDAVFWQRYTPLGFDAATCETLAQRMVTEGYFQAEPIDWALPIAAMAAVVQTLRDQGIPPIFAYMYDEFWLTSIRLRSVLAAMLGDDFIALPNFWVWHIDPTTAEQGWQPHRDRGRKTIFADGRPKIVNLWLPLTDATPLNGCMYIVPADRDPSYNREDEMVMQYQLYDIRALPAAAGSVLGWNQAVLHWGSHAVPRADQPRISIGSEFQRRDVEPFSTPFIDIDAMPDFNERQYMIGLQIERYRHHYHQDTVLTEFSQQFAAAIQR